MKQLLIFVMATGILCGPASADQEQAFNSLAREILVDLDRAPMDSLPASSGYGIPRIVVKTRTTEGRPSKAGRELNRKFLHSLKRTAKGRYRFVAIEAVGALIASIKHGAATSKDSDASIHVLRANARPDIVILGIYKRETSRTTLSYQAVSPETGELLASASAVFTRSLWAAPPAVRPTSNPPLTGLFRPTVDEVERLLVEKGYDPGPVDGFLTEQTRQALRAYQINTALPVNGRLTRNTVMNLRRDARASVF